MSSEAIARLRAEAADLKRTIRVYRKRLQVTASHIALLERQHAEQGISFVYQPSEALDASPTARAGIADDADVRDRSEE
jgi:uncharacterized protein YciI